MSTMAAVAGRPIYTPAAYEPGVPKRPESVLNDALVRESAGNAADRQHSSIFAAPPTEATVAAVPARPVHSGPCAVTPRSPTPSTTRSVWARSWTWWHDPRLRGGRNRLDVAKAVLNDPELELVGAVARRVAAQDLGATLGIGAVGLLISPTVDAALRVGCDVLVDYTSHAAVRSHIDLAVGRGVACVVGSSGLTEADYAAIDLLRRRL